MEPISSYFNAERTESIIFIVIALVALIASCWFIIALKTPFFIGMAISLTLIAALQLIVGLTIYQRSPIDNERVQQMVRSAPDQLQSEEVVRMNVVIRNFKIYLGVELILLIISLISLKFFTSGSLIQGSALGLALQAIFTAVLDLIAMKRGESYLNWLILQS